MPIIPELLRMVVGLIQRYVGVCLRELISKANMYAKECEHEGQGTRGVGAMYRNSRD